MQLLLRICIIILSILLSVLSLLLPSNPTIYINKEKESSCLHLQSKSDIELFQTNKEIENLMNFCVNTTNFKFKDFSYLTIKDIKIFSIKSAKSCPFDDTKLLFGWISFKKYKEDSSEFLKFKEYHIITRKDDYKHGDYVYGFYLHYVENNASSYDSFINDVANIRNIEQFNNTDNISVLVEILPSSYKLYDIKYKLWKNTTLKYKIPIKNITLENNDFHNIYIVDDIDYSFNQTFKINLTDVLEFNYKIPGKYEYDNDYIDLNKGGYTKILRNKSLEYSYDLPANSRVNATLIADWVVNEYIFTSSVLFQYYDYVISFINHQDIRKNKMITITKIADVKLIYDNPLYLDNYEKIKIDNKEKFGNIKHSSYTIDKPIYPETPIKSPIESEIKSNDTIYYSAFEPYFILGCVVVSVIFFVACAGVIKGLIDDRKKTQYHKVPIGKDAEENNYGNRVLEQIATMRKAQAEPVRGKIIPVERISMKTFPATKVPEQTTAASIVSGVQVPFEVVPGEAISEKPVLATTISVRTKSGAAQIGKPV